MEVGDVFGGIELVENGSLFLGAAVFDEGESLITVTGEDDVVEEVFVILELKDYFAVDVFDAGDRFVQVDFVLGKVFHDGIDVLLRASGDGHPTWTSGQGAEQVVVPHEADESHNGKMQ